MATDIRALLSQPVETVERPKALPAAWYRGRITGYDADQKSKNKQTPFIRFFFAVSELAPGMENIDMAGVGDLSRKELRKDLYITPDSLWRLREFVCGVTGIQSGRNIDALIPECRNAEVLIEVTQRQDEQDPETFWNDVGKVARAA